MKQRLVWRLALGLLMGFPLWAKTSLHQRVVASKASTPLPALYTDSLPGDWKDKLSQRNRDLSRRVRKAAYRKQISPKMNSAMNKVLSASYREMSGYFSQNKRYSLTQQQYESLLRTQDDARSVVDKQVPADGHPELSPLGAPAEAVEEITNLARQLVNRANAARAKKKMTKDQERAVMEQSRAIRSRLSAFFRENKYNDINAAQYAELKAELAALDKEIPEDSHP